LEYDNDQNDNEIREEEKRLNKEGQDNELVKAKKQNKKSKPLKRNMGMTFFKLLLALFCIGLFFILNYNFSSGFLEDVSKLSKELNVLISRPSYLLFVVLLQKQ